MRWCLRMGLFGMAVCLCRSTYSFDIDWFTVDGGGGVSTGGVFTLSGTIGQSDATEVPSTNSPYAVSGGFWMIQLVQTPGAPLLRLAPATAGSVTLSWTPDTPGFVLQENVDLSTTNWVNSASGNQNPTLVPVGDAERFYRLFKP